MKSLLAFAFCLLCCCSTTFVSAEDGLSSRISAIIDNLSNFGWKSEDRMHADDCHCENGRCVKDSRGRWKCLCKPKYALQEDFECKECDCGNNGNCIFNKNFNPNTNEWQFDKKCVCNKGYAEKNGQCIACLCGENSKCEFEGDEKICYCEEGFAETDGKCTACDCGEGGICEFHDGKKVCSCFDDFAFNGRICQACNCGDRSKGCNFESGTKTCNCPTGHTERNGQCEELCTTDEGCGHGGTCVPDGEGKKCVCMPGLSGDTCEHIDECISGKFSKCKGAKGTCTYSKEEQKAYCKCDERMMFNDTSNICLDCNCGNYGTGCYVKDDIKTCICYKGFTEKYGKCEETCVTDAGCGHGGTCVRDGDVKKCVCMPGLSGDWCQHIDECSDTGKFKRCRGINGKCTYSKEEKKAFCDCGGGAMWFDHSLDICVDGCLKDVCHNGGKCKVAEDEILCDCGKGLSGEFCEVVNDCVNGTFKNCRGEQGSCTYSQEKQEAVCECAGKKKLDSTSNTCKECDCGLHSLDCGFENQQKRCKCPEKYVEEDGICQSIACTKANCNGGTCRITGDKAECVCPSFQVLVNGKCVYDCENYVDEDIDDCEVCDD